ncbi:MAG: Na(+)-translocating NADH-quinone reductase subunit A [Candidatus Omnitrophica bacterium]|nr:Na(+)-translocating NADH-quinone reductase subunit A [Candidatus Omnitrophota bacterium]
MRKVRITKGRNIPLKGAAAADLQELPLPAEVAVPFFEFPPHCLRLLVKEGDALQVGSPLAEDRRDPRVVVVSPVSGTVRTVKRGDKRALLSVRISTDGRQEKLLRPRFDPGQLSGLSRDELLDRLVGGGVWPFIRQRPFDRVADPKIAPKSIFVRALNTDPLAPDVDILLQGKEDDFQAGLEILRKLTPGPVCLCFGESARSRALREARHVESVVFSGPHPAGNVGTHVHHLDPLGKGEAVWFLEAQDVPRLASLLFQGVFDPGQTVAVTGEGAAFRRHVRTVLGAQVSHLLGGPAVDGVRYLSGSVLSGYEVSLDDSVGIYASQLTALPAGGTRKFLGWAGPRFGEFTFSRMIGGGLFPAPEVSLDTDNHGSERAVVLNDVYDGLQALDVLTFFLLRAILAGEVQEMVRLGILECSPEDFALCTFACPSKVDVSGVIRQGLELIEKEG